MVRGRGRRGRRRERPPGAVSASTRRRPPRPRPASSSSSNAGPAPARRPRLRRIRALGPRAIDGGVHACVQERSEVRPRGRFPVVVARGQRRADVGRRTRRTAPPLEPRGGRGGGRGEDLPRRLRARPLPERARRAPDLGTRVWAELAEPTSAALGGELLVLGVRRGESAAAAIASNAASSSRLVSASGVRRASIRVHGGSRLRARAPRRLRRRRHRERGGGGERGVRRGADRRGREPAGAGRGAARGDAARQGWPARTHSSRAASIIPPRTKRNAALQSRVSASAFVGCGAPFARAGPSGSSSVASDRPRPSEVADASNARAVSFHAHSFRAKSPTPKASKEEETDPASRNAAGSVHRSAPATSTPSASRVIAARALPSSHATTRFARNVTGSRVSSRAAMRTRAERGAGAGSEFGAPPVNRDAVAPAARGGSALAARARVSAAAPSRSASAPSPSRNHASDHVAASASRSSASHRSSCAVDARAQIGGGGARSAARTRQTLSNAAGVSASATAPARTSATTRANVGAPRSARTTRRRARTIPARPGFWGARRRTARWRDGGWRTGTRGDFAPVPGTPPPPSAEAPEGPWRRCLGRAGGTYPCRARRGGHPRGGEA